MLAALSNQAELVQIVLTNCKPGIDHVNRYGETALHIARRKNINEAYKLLKHLGCSIRIKNREGLSIFDIE